MRIVWDEAKRVTNLARHELDFAEIEPHFDWDQAILIPTYAGRRGERRYVAIGLLHDELVALVFAKLGTEAISAISLRRASRQERMLHDGP